MKSNYIPGPPFKEMTKEEVLEKFPVVEKQRKRELRIGEEVLRHLKQNHPIDIRNLSIEDQPSRQRKRHIKRQLMKKFKSNRRNKNDDASNV